MKKNISLVLALWLWLPFWAGGQSLPDYQQMAGQENPGLSALYKAYEASLQKIPQSQALNDPTLSLGYFLSPVETRVGPQQLRFSLVQVFPWFGTLKAQGNLAALRAEADFQRFIDARSRLYQQVAEAYLRLYEREKLSQISRENIAILVSYQEQSLQNYRQGKGSMADVLRVKLEIQEADVRYVILQAQEPSLLASFNALLNRPAESPVNVALPTTGPEPLPQLPDSVLRHHPQTETLAALQQQAEVQQTLAAKQAMPKMGVGLDYVLVGQRNNQDLADNGKNILMPMLSVSLPIYQKKNQAAKKEAGLMYEQYSQQQEGVLQNLQAAYAKAYFKWQQQQTLMALYQQQIETAQQVLDLLLVSYSQSASEFEEILRLQKQLLQYQKSYVEAEVQAGLAMAEMDYLSAK